MRKIRQDRDQEREHERADDNDPDSEVAFGADGALRLSALAEGLHRLAEGRDDRGQRLDEGHHARAGDRTRTDVPHVRTVDPLGVRVARHPGVREAQALQVLDDSAFRDEDRDERNQREPGEHAARGELARDAGADDVAEPQVLRRDVAVQCGIRDLAVLARAEPGGGLAPEPENAVQELVEHRRAHALEDHPGEVAALLAGDENVGAGHALGIFEVAVLLDDEGPPQRNHEEDAERAADGGEDEDRHVLEIGRPVGEEEQGRHREDDARRDRLARRADRLHHVVLEDRGLAEPLENRDRQNRDRHRGRDRQAGAQGQIDRRGAEDDAEENPQEDRLERELGNLLARRNVGTELRPGRRLVRHATSAFCVVVFWPRIIRAPRRSAFRPLRCPRSRP